MGSEMCIRDRVHGGLPQLPGVHLAQALVALPADAAFGFGEQPAHCLLYTSDAADERSSVDLGGRRILKKKNTTTHNWR